MIEISHHHSTMYRVDFDGADLELAEQAMRGLADRYLQEAKKHPNPDVRENFQEHAKRCERITERIVFARQSQKRE